MIREPRRLIASLIAIVFGVTFATFTLTVSSTFEKSLGSSVEGAAAGAAVVVRVSEQNGQPIPPAALTAMRGVPGVTAVQPDTGAVVYTKTSKGEQMLYVVVLPRAETVRVVDGRLPSAKDEIVVNERLASARGLAVGSKVELTQVSEPTTLTVTGVVAPDKNAYNPADPTAFGREDDVLRLSGADGFYQAFVYGTRPPADIKADVKALPAVKAGGQVVETVDEYVEAQRKDLANFMTAITAFFLAFAVVALVVAALVIANTFSILVAQRTRQLALLRCVGATRAQVFRTVLGEAALLGLVAGGVGVLIGIGIAYALVLLSRGTDFELSRFAVSPVAVLLPWGIALGMTVLAALLPARRATRVAPLAALRPQLAPVTATRAGIATLIVGAVLAVAGTAGLLYGAVKPGGKGFDWTYLVAGIAGGFAAFVGVMMLGTVIIPALARVVGAIPARLGGVPGRLAAENSRRNPARAAATASALLVGVTLITMTFVGAATATASQDRELDRLFPADLTVSPSGGALPDAVMAKVAGSSVVSTVERADRTGAKVNGRDVEVVGLGPRIRDVLRDTRGIDGLGDSTILLSPKSGIADGSQVTLEGEAGKVVLTAVVRPKGPATPTVTLSTLAKVSSERYQEAWVRLKDGVKASDGIETLSGDLAQYPVQISGAAQAREGFEQVMTIVLSVINGLLAVSVLIALVGITNTLGLSVLERTQESGLLRALGLTRGRLRWMFSLEALTLAAVAALLGVGLGIGFGLAGSYALLGGTIEVVPAVPWGTVAAIVLGAMAAGLVASIVPAIRAGRIQPAAALAYE